MEIFPTCRWGGGAALTHSLCRVLNFSKSHNKSLKYIAINRMEICAKLNKVMEGGGSLVRYFSATLYNAWNDCTT